MSRARVAIIGAGQVGATTAQRLAEKNVCDIVLLDVIEGFAAGKALDLMQAAPIEGHGSKVAGTTRYEDIKGSDIVVVTAGLARKPGMSREDLLLANAKIVGSVCDGIKQNAPNAIIITVTNPLDIMTQYVHKLTGFPKERVIGMAGVLDSARMRYFISLEAGCRPDEVTAMVLGGHGDLMVPVMSQIRVKGKPFSMSPEKTKAIIERTQQGGAEIVALLKIGSAFYAPASSVAAMVISILEDKKEVLPACAYCTGEYGIRDTYCGVPVRLGRKGAIEIVQMELSESEKQGLHQSADKVRKGVEELERLSVGTKA